MSFPRSQTSGLSLGLTEPHGVKSDIFCKAAHPARARDTLSFVRGQYMRTVYFDDLEVGAEYVGPECVVDAQEMLEYNRRNDPWPIHVDEAAARQSPFGGVIASGGYTITLLYRLSHQIHHTRQTRWAFLGGLDWQVKFPAAVKAGDTLRYRLTVLSKRASSKPGRGVAKVKSELTNQRGEVVLEVNAAILLATHPVLADP